MRGDSVRDLYAKVLALLGLTVLAGAGALVDYWPVRSPLPRISFHASVSTGLRPLDVEPVLAASVRVTPSAPAPGVRFAPVVMTEVNAAAFVDTLPSVEVPTEAPVVTPAPEIAQPEPATALDVQPANVGALAAAPVELSAPTQFEALGVSHASPTAVSSGNPLQKAGNTLLNGAFAVGNGMATGLKGIGKAFGNIGKLFTNSSH